MTTRDEDAKAGTASFASVLIQIMVLDIVFSLDSVITAVGMAQHLWVMVTAMIVAVVVMLIFADSVSEFINRHPSMKVLALSFLLLIGVLLVAEGFGKHVGKGYIYFAMAFSLAIELSEHAPAQEAGTGAPARPVRGRSGPAKSGT